jgi:Domain of unknown function (DUF4868)
MPIQVGLMLARRPRSVGQEAFGHVDVTQKGRVGLDGVVDDAVLQIQGRAEIDFNPDDRAGADEVLTGQLKGFDNWFQAQARWSLERAVDEIRNPGLPVPLDADQIRHGGWSFYIIRTEIDGTDVIVVRAKKPNWGLGDGKFIGAIIGTHLQPVEEPLLSFDRQADLIVVGDKVFVVNADAAERLFVDAEAVKRRAPETTQKFGQGIGARLSAPTLDAVQAVISRNAIVGRRVEKLLRAGNLGNVTAAGVRAALAEAGLQSGDFGTSGALQAVTEDHATKLIEIAADLYYQPRFEQTSRKVGAWRRVR